MIALRRDEERSHVRRDEQDAWFTFYRHHEPDRLVNGFAALELLDEHRIPPGADISLRPRHDAEIITYVREGAVAQEASVRGSRLIRSGEFQRSTAGRDVLYSETNASQTEWAHVFQMTLVRSEAALTRSHEQRRFCAAERRGVLCVVASPDARRGSLRLHQDALLYSAMLEPGQHVIHELSPMRSAWLHLVCGEATLGDVVLSAGDGVGVAYDRAVSFTAREESEILLLDLGPRLER